MARGRSEKTEKATPKRREEARKEGQVAKLAGPQRRRRRCSPGCSCSARPAPRWSSGWPAACRDSLAADRRPGPGHDGDRRRPADAQRQRRRDVPGADRRRLRGRGASSSTSPRSASSPTTKAMKPNLKRINPQAGLQEHPRPKQGLVEVFKNVLKVGVVGAIVLGAFLPQLTDYAAMVGISPLAARRRDRRAGQVDRLPRRLRLPPHRGRRLLLAAPLAREEPADEEAGGQGGGQGPGPPARGQAAPSAASRARPPAPA